MNYNTTTGISAEKQDGKVETAQKKVITGNIDKFSVPFN